MRNMEDNNRFGALETSFTNKGKSHFLTRKICDVIIIEKAINLKISHQSELDLYP